MFDADENRMMGHRMVKKNNDAKIIKPFSSDTGT